MTARSLLYPAVTLALAAAPLVGQQPTQQARADSTIASGSVTPTVVLQAEADGAASGARIGTAGWFVGGFFSGAALGILGTYIHRSVAGRDAVELPADRRRLIASQPVAYQHAYEKSFATRVRAKRKSSVLYGGILGMGTMTVLYLSSR